MIAVADTSGLVAAFNRADPEHAAVADAANTCGLLVVSALSLTEVHQVATIRAGRTAADSIMGTIAARAASGRVAIADVAARHLRAAIDLRRRYFDLDLDFADTMAAVTAAEYRTTWILTLDRRDFRVLRPLTGEPAFRLLPDDA